MILHFFVFRPPSQWVIIGQRHLYFKNQPCLLYMYAIYCVFLLFQASYLMFLAIYSFFVMTDLHPISVKSPSNWEYLTWAWAATQFVEEIRQVNKNYNRNNTLGIPHLGLGCHPVCGRNQGGKLEYNRNNTKGKFAGAVFGGNKSI